ncbi:MAG TPA: DNA polymerase [Kofleriaceae bacterium]|nr:DNA polymerase [Kofleriaceae bacterium]
MPDRTLIVSATNVLARGYFAVPIDRKSPAGEPVNALFAVARAVEKALTFKQPARALAVVEANAPPASWPQILQAQLPRLVPLLETLGFAIVRAPDELHVVASYVDAALARGDDVVVVGTDKRYAQIVGERSWWYDANKDARYTPEMVYKRFGVGPEHVAEWLALVGNDDDGLPGIAGIGAKGATGLLDTYGSIAGALAAIDAIKGRAGNALRAAVDQLPAELARTTLERTRPLPVPLDATPYTSPPAAPLNALYRELGFLELLASEHTDRIQVAVLESAGDIAAALASTTGPVALQILTEDPTPVRGALVGIALATGDHRASYLPTPSDLDPQLAAWLADPARPKLGHDTKAAIAALRRRGIELAGIAGDTAVASHLAQPSNWAPHDLPIVAKYVLGRALPAEDGVRGVGQKRKPWAALTVERAGEYAGQLADAVAATWSALAPAVDRTLHAEYMDLSETLVRMELLGIGVDAEELGRAEQAFAPIEAELEQQITQLAGRSINLGSTKQLGQVLFEELGLPVVSHTKTGWSTATEALERIEHAHPIVPLVIRWRLLRRLRDSWIVALRGTIADDGRVHACFHPARSFSGRIVSTNPDLSRVPGRTPEMARIRRAFVARPGHLLMSVDYQQLGLHVLAHLTKDPALVEPLRARADVHAQTAAAVLEKPQAAITADERQLGKLVNFATFAGQGSSALALQLGVKAAEAKELIARFDRTYSKVREFQDEQLRLARERGYIVTIAGRHWPIGGLESLDPHDRSYAERLARRATHEGSVADVSRRGLLDADRALRAAGLAAAPMVQIVDEVLFEVPEREVGDAAQIAAAAMRDAFALEAPLRVGVEVGPNWADLQALD